MLLLPPSLRLSPSPPGANSLIRGFKSLTERERERWTCCCSLLHQRYDGQERICWKNPNFPLRIPERGKYLLPPSMGYLGCLGFSRTQSTQLGVDSLRSVFRKGQLNPRRQQQFRQRVGERDRDKRLTRDHTAVIFSPKEKDFLILGAFCHFSTIQSPPEERWTDRDLWTGAVNNYSS